MDNILKERLVNRSGKKNFHFTLTCAVCGAVWQSTPIPVEGNRDHFQSAYIEAQQAAYREAEAHFVTCRLCGDPACERCHVNLGEMTVCSNCAKRMTQ